jgi:hypothetical protein
MPRGPRLQTGILLAVVVAIAGSVPAASASPSRSRMLRYVGTTSQGLDMEFAATADPDSLRITSFEFDYELTCLIDGTHQRVGAGFSAGVDVHDGQFAYVAHGQTDSIDFSGSISPTAAAGLTRWAFPAFTQDERPQKCTTPDLSWTAAPAGGGVRISLSPAAPGAISLARDPTGRIFALGRGSSDVGRAPLVKVFVGTNAQGLDMEFNVGASEQGLRVTGYQFEYRIRCRIDGSVQRLGIGGGWPLPTPITNGHFSVDALAQDAAFEFSGSITPTMAAGLSRFAMPEFTRDEVPQKCSTGDLAWTASPSFS